MPAARTLVPEARRGFAFHPVDAAVQTILNRRPAVRLVFRLDLSDLGMGTARVVFGGEPGVRPTLIHTDLGGQPMSLYRRGPPPGKEPR